MSEKFLRFLAVIARTGLCRSTIYSQISDGLWPKPVSLGSRAIGWPNSEIEALIGARLAGQSNDGIRELVARLEAARLSGREVV